MALDRRRLMQIAGAGAATLAAGAARGATPMSALGVDAAHLGARPGSPDDQTVVLQRAIDRTAASRTPLALPPGVYRAAGLQLPAGAQLIGVRGATRLVLGQGRPLIVSNGADDLTLAGLVLDGGGKALPDKAGLVHLANGRRLRITDCEIAASGRHGVLLEAMDGEIAGTQVVDAAGFAILCYNARGLLIARNVIRRAGDNGIVVMRWENGDDGTLVVDNRIEDVSNRSGGSGQYGNGINAHRSGNVIISRNRIRGCAFSAVRGNAASNIQITGNSCSDLGEVAIYSEFGFEGAVIADNSIDGAALGVTVCNFNEGGRLAAVHGNIVRNLKPKRPEGTDPGDSAGIGIYVEADAAVTGNVVEKAPTAGIMVGWGRYLRDVSVTGNVVRSADVGVAVSVTPGAGAVVIADNVIAETVRGAIVGFDHKRAVTGDLARDGAGRYAHLSIAGNRLR
jgi:uncharacterized secreted repeat protein (TIGR03808 family)